MSVVMDVSQIEGINMVGKGYQATSKTSASEPSTGESSANISGRVFRARISSSGQVTIPAEIRKMLGVEKNDEINFEVGDDTVTIKRPMTWDEYFENQRKWVEAEKKRNPAFAKAWEENKGKTPDEMLTEWADSLEGQQYFKEKYGI